MNEPNEQESPDEKPKAGAKRGPKPKAGAKEVAAEVVAAIKADEKPEGVIEEGRVEAAKYAEETADDRAFALKNNCPEPPRKNPRLGDKTPAYVDWLRQYRPDRYEAKYGIERKDQRVPVYGEDGEVVRHEIRDVGRRKTHLSEKIERDPALDESMDWNA